MTIDLNGVFAVPPLARRNVTARSIDFVENERIVKHISSGGISRLIYGGNAFLYHIELDGHFVFTQGRRASLRSALAPGYHIPRLRRGAH